MKNLNLFAIIFLFILFSEISKAQTDTNYIWTYELNNAAFHSWDSINNIWMKEVYFPCLKENKLKMSCAHCSGIFIDAGFEIDDNGKLIHIQIFREKVCVGSANQKLKDCFLNYFRQMVFPEPLRNHKIKVKLGTSLKC
ncbi:MAG: hypothetical protein U0W24_04400 [Bacteroidales bacterium]